MTAARTAMDIVEQCENILGWNPPTTLRTPLWKARVNAAHMLKQAMKKDPNKVTLHNLELAIEWSRRKRKPINTPATLVSRIDTALLFAQVEQPTTDLDDRVRQAIDREIGIRDEQSTPWIALLTRSVGAGREDVLREWKEAGRG